MQGVTGEKVTDQNAEAGLAVERGPDWKWDDQDGGIGKVGVLVNQDGTGWWAVRWEGGRKNSYRTGNAGGYDLRFSAKDPPK